MYTHGATTNSVIVLVLGGNNDLIPYVVLVERHDEDLAVKESK
jgi:hypothetical protein